jgi:hypothetical protein
LPGTDRLHDLIGDAVAELLLAEAAGSIAQAIGPRAVYYRPRRDELCGLVAGDLLGMEQTLVNVLGLHNAEYATVGLAAGFGTVIVPREARTAGDAIALADLKVVGVMDRRTAVARAGLQRGRLFSRNPKAA